MDEITGYMRDVIRCVMNFDTSEHPVTIAKEVALERREAIKLSRVHRILYRLEREGVCDSKLVAASELRNGKRKRVFHLTSFGRKLFEEAERSDKEIRIGNKLQIVAT